ncbi:DUF3372 domain-containing protein [Saccharobesus litoralis]|uniref:DUF3372 domain-containing protein n=1 Tax=Saccharobesus litoralis TaxID=2172099 RepID=A0A2S0VRZ2_9ALTE|nr:alpha-1,6-glucosidase domain-containing protein [Saccharobesus litoralis]AWB66932.1 DUF3372 domain-containing protein [Saccharobesus litoralis]
MIHKQVTSSAIALALASVLAGCNTSNEESLANVPGSEVVDIPLVCRAPDTIKVDSFGNQMFDTDGALMCERVELPCVGQDYDPIKHTCNSKGRHPDAPDEVDGAKTSVIENELNDGSKYATIFFKTEEITTKDQADAAGIIIHAWNSADCNAYDPDFFEKGATQDPDNDNYWATDWATGVLHSGFDDNYGLYWRFKLLDDHSDCANFIIHKGDTKYPDGDMKAYLGGEEDTPRFNVDRMSYVENGITKVGNASTFPYYVPEDEPSDGIRVASKDRAIHWFNADTLLFNTQSDQAQTIRLYSTTAVAKLFPGEGFRNMDDYLIGDYVEFTRTSDSLDADELERAKYRRDFAQFSVQLNTDENATDEQVNQAKTSYISQVKELLKGRVMAILYDKKGDPFISYLVQTAGVLDDLYTGEEDKADTVKLGADYHNNTITTSVWAPTASQVKLKLYNDKNSSGEYTEIASKDMAYNDVSGIWSYTGDTAELDRKLFRYEVSVYHPMTDSFEVHEVIDPYALSVTTNGRYARFVNLNDSDLKPAGWDNHTIPAGQNPEDIVVYEGHIRDFSILDDSTAAENRGKYLAFTEVDTAPVNHLKSLQQAGLTHFQVLPANDIASTNEDISQQVNVTDTVADLCAVKADLTICSEASATAVIQDALAAMDPASNTVNQTLQALRGLDGFNWGYDPYAYNVPEGGYSSDPESVARIVEMRSMVQALHEAGLRASIDVVYNHTSASGLWDNSVFDKIVPGYYHRLNVDTGAVIDNSCCQDTAGENAMFAKFVKDSLVSWAEHYKFDAFRFDLMNLLPKDLVLEAREAVLAIDDDNYFYGEGWNFGMIANFGAVEEQMAGTQFGTFSDRQRDAVRHAALFNQGGNGADVDTIRVGLVANLENYTLQNHQGNFGRLSALPNDDHGYAKDPADIVNYVGKHDNETLWDQLQLGLPDDLSSAERARIHAVAGSFPILSQGIPFIQMGQDLLRSKSMDRNTYDSGDLLNKVDFTKQDHNWNISFPLEYSCWGDESADNCKARLQGLLAQDSRKAQSVDIEWASAVYQDFLKIRKSSKLFRLTSAEQIMDRVGFHNTGSSQTHGVIVMSLDDGAGCKNGTKDYAGNCDVTTDLRADLDPNYDGLIVVFNGTATEQTMVVPTALGFALHDVQANSDDSVVASASVSEVDGNGQFTVPAYTTAVFAKKQDGAQGAGINIYATVGEPDIPPYDATTIYLRGDMNEWSENNAFEYKGAGIYETVVELAAQDYSFKVADANWSYPNIGGGVNVALNTATTLGANGDDLSVTISKADKYKFVLNAKNPNAPILTIESSIEQPAYGATPVYIRGGMNGWGAADPMLFVGNATYVIRYQLAAGDHSFKFASEDWSAVNFGAGSTTNTTVDSPLTLDGGSDATISIAQDGMYTFSINASNASAPIVTVSRDEQPYLGGAVYLRGYQNNWDNTTPANQFTYYGNGYYAITMAHTGDTQFKIASEGWSPVNFGGSGLALHEPLTLEHNAGDIALTGLDATNVQFILKVNDEATQDATITVIDLANYQ